MAITLNGTTGVTTTGLTADTDTLYVDTTNDRVGVGTTSPTQKLHVSSGYSNLNGLRISGSDTSNTIYQSSGDFQLSSDGGNIGVRVNPTGAYFRVLTEGTERMRIDSSGYVLVGCTAYPSSSVAGAALSPSVVSVNPHRFSVGSGTGVITVITFVNGNGIVGAINTSGSNTVYSTSSDYRLKDNIAPMTGALNKVSLLKPCTYTWKADGSNGEGFIAHELAEVFPDAVVGEKDAVDADGEIKAQSIDTSFLVATLTAAIQEQQAIITDLKSRIEALEQA